MNTVHLWQALTDGIQIEDASLGTITLHQRKLGELVLSTGQVVACDPLVFPDTKPFHATLPPGRYPVIASVASFVRNSDRRIAYALLVESLIQDFLSHEELDVTLNPFTGANAIMFASGWGDGFYASYWGYDTEDNTVCLVTDFALLRHPALKSDRPSSKRRRRLVNTLFHLWQHRG